MVLWIFIKNINYHLVDLSRVDLWRKWFLHGLVSKTLTALHWLIQSWLTREGTFSARDWPQSLFWIFCFRFVETAHLSFCQKCRAMNSFSITQGFVFWLLCWWAISFLAFEWMQTFLPCMHILSSQTTSMTLSSIIEHYSLCYTVLFSFKFAVFNFVAHVFPFVQMHTEYLLFLSSLMYF